MGFEMTTTIVAPHPAPSGALTPHALRRLSRRALLNAVDTHPAAMDAARARSDEVGAKRARRLWDHAWDELDRRDGIPVEAEQ
jgi:hypothetical protein